MRNYVKMVTLLACAFVVLSWTGPARAADVTGDWKWKFSGQNGQEIEMMVSLKQDGEKLSGTVGRVGGNRKTEITDGSIKNDEVSFVTVLERNNNKINVRYKGKLEGDTIKGKVERERDGQTQSNDWEAKREKK